MKSLREVKTGMDSSVVVGKNGKRDKERASEKAKGGKRRKY